MIRNPYTNRAKIENPSDFFGRKRIVRKIYERISTPGRPQSVSIVGDRRIGKSSLLHYIYHPEIRKKYLDDNYLFVFVDFSIYGQMSPKNFLMLLSKKLSDEEAYQKLKTGPDKQESKENGIFSKIKNFFSKQTYLLDDFDESTSTFPDSVAPITSIDYDAFIKKIEKYKEKKLIFFFDEFDLITRNRSFNLDFFSFLRGIANNYKVAYITSSAHDLQNVSIDEIIGSPFFNIFSTMVLEPFTQQEAIELITDPFQQNSIKLSDSEIEFILEIAGLHPFFLQVACYQLFEHRRDASETTENDQYEIREAYALGIQAHLEYIWQHLENSEKRVLLKLVKSEEITRSERHIIKNLNRKGYLVGDRIFSTVFVDYVEQKTAPDQTEEDGTTAPRFEILEELGRGGMGVVYKAKDTVLGRMVAIKELLPTQDRDSIALNRFFSEAKAAAALNHPNIVKIYDLDENRRYIIMEYIDGKSVKEKGRLTPVEATQIMIRVVDALAEVHQNEIIHRDLKPANIMLDNRDEVKITDFGVAHIVGSTATAIGQRIGTGIYMSPEQHRGDQIDHRSDIFSLGLVFYEILTGRRIFSRESDLVRYYTLQDLDYTPLQVELPAQGNIKTSPNIIRILDKIILKCLALNPDDRYATMTEVKTALQKVASEI